nr:immunoglobulin heavy chain junction region [Mus musculus]MBK4195351.1 immunoglobulin heavy chain junction region [Mus musculus]MBK4195352.1 immunoglobulin heavy chain junction region [Mus musculus]
CVRGQGFAYW